MAASTGSTHAVALGLALLNASLQEFARRPQLRQVHHRLLGGHQAMLIMMHRLYPHLALKPTIAFSAPLLSQRSLPMGHGCQEWSAGRRVLLWRPNSRATGTRARSHEDNAPPTCVSTVIAAVFGLSRLSQSVHLLPGQRRLPRCQFHPQSGVLALVSAPKRKNLRQRNVSQQQYRKLAVEKCMNFHGRAVQMSRCKTLGTTRFGTRAYAHYVTLT